MKNIFISLVTIFFIFSCGESKINFKNIDDDIKCYEVATSFLKVIYKSDRNIDTSEIYSTLNEMIINLDYMSNQCLNEKISISERKKIISTINQFCENTCSKCVDSIGDYQYKSVNDSNYYYKMKLSYIDCIVDKSSFSDTINKACITILPQIKKQSLAPRYINKQGAG